MLSAFIAGDDDIHIVPLSDGVDQLRDLFRRMLKIIIHGDDEISLRMRESTQKSRMLSEVSRHLDDLHTGIFLSKFFHDLVGTVFGTIIHKDQFKGFLHGFTEDFLETCIKFR